MQKIVFVICGLFLFSVSGHTEDEVVEQWEKDWYSTILDMEKQASGEYEFVDKKLKSDLAHSIKGYCMFLSNILGEMSYNNYMEFNDPDGMGIRTDSVEQLGKTADLLFKHCGKYLSQ